MARSDSTVWTKVVDEQAWLLNQKSAFIEDIASEDAIVNSVGTTSLVFRSQLLRIFAQKNPSSKEGSEELSALILLVIAAGLSKKKRRATQVLTSAAKMDEQRGRYTGTEHYG